MEEIIYNINFGKRFQKTIAAETHICFLFFSQLFLTSAKLNQNNLKKRVILCITNNNKHSFRVCLVMVKSGKMENRQRKIKWKMTFSPVQFKREDERQKMGRKIFPPGPHFFIHPIWEENGEEKVLNDILYTNILTLFLSRVNDYYYFFPLFPEVFNLHTTHI